MFDKSVGGKQLIVAAGTGWAYFILFYSEIKKRIQFHGFTQGFKKRYGERTEKEANYRFSSQIGVRLMVEQVTS